MDRTLGGIIYMVFAICTGIIGKHIHGSIFWAIIDWLFAPIVWFKWLICEEVTLNIVKHSFDFFFK